jgi:hypothetical protein
MGKFVSYDALGLVEPGVDCLLDLPKIVIRRFDERPALVLGVGGESECLDDAIEVFLGQQSGVGQMKMIFFDAVIAARCFLMAAVFCYAEFCYLFSVLALAHNYKNKFHSTTDTLCYPDDPHINFKQR